MKRFFSKMAMAIDNENETNIGLDVIQSMIDISADRLEGLRTQCATSAELTQQEIRNVETKLVKMFSELLITKSKLPERLPKGLPATGAELRQWLRVVGLSPESLNVVMQRVSTLESLLDKNDIELRSILSHNANVREEETRRLERAMFNLKRCRESIQLGEKEPADLFWDSWDRHHHIHYRSGASPRPHRSTTRHHLVHSPPPEISLPENNFKPLRTLADELTRSGANNSFTPSPSPPSSPLIINNNKPRTVKGFPTTPPPHKKHQTLLGQPSNFTLTTSSASICSNNQNLYDGHFLTKSLSHEWINQQFDENSGHSVVKNQPIPVPYNSNPNGNQTSRQAVQTSRSRLNTEPTADNYVDHFDNLINLQVPRSPCTPTMGHQISHRFSITWTVGTCEFCKKQLLYGVKCKECKYVCHRDCQKRVPPSCGLPREFVDIFRRKIESDALTSSWKKTEPDTFKPNSDRTKLGYAARPINDSSAASSRNSSTPSSPALASLNAVAVPQTTTSKHTEFDFPDLASTSSTVICVQEINSPRREGFFQKPISPSAWSSLFVNATNLFDNSEYDISFSSESTNSDPLCVTSIPESEDRETENVTQEPTMSSKEWDIPFDDLIIKDKIGAGRFGIVYGGQWHGEVAVKFLVEGFLDNEAFISQVAIFKKARHQNVILFMGACVKPQVIVTEKCNGYSLYNHIHQRKDKLSLTKIRKVAQQITDGMGYLNAKGIIHKDLRSKNVFLENLNKAVITDFGLFSVTKLHYKEDVGVALASNWLCYLAPELIHALKPYPPDTDDMPFSRASDAYAFGTVFYELLCGEFPFKAQEPEAIIYQIGRGMKQTLANLQASREVKDILMACWTYEPESRCDFPKARYLLSKLPKKTLTRSPSHPVQLSRSAESVF